MWRSSEGRAVASPVALYEKEGSAEKKGGTDDQHIEERTEVGAESAERGRRSIGTLLMMFLLVVMHRHVRRRFDVDCRASDNRHYAVIERGHESWRT